MTALRTAGFPMLLLVAAAMLLFTAVATTINGDSHDPLVLVPMSPKAESIGLVATTAPKPENGVLMVNGGEILISPTTFTASGAAVDGSYRISAQAEKNVTVSASSTKNEVRLSGKPGSSGIASISLLGTKDGVIALWGTTVQVVFR